MRSTSAMMLQFLVSPQSSLLGSVLRMKNIYFIEFQNPVNLTQSSERILVLSNEIM